MAISICVFCGSRYGADPRFRAAATRFGELAGSAQIRLIYGGGHVGLMGAVADAAIAAGGEVIGLIPTRLLEREVGHRAITELVVTQDMFERKQQMIDRADAFVVLPGGLGTLDELLEVVTLRQLGYHAKPIVVVNLGGYLGPADRARRPRGRAEVRRARARARSTAWSMRSRRSCRRSASGSRPPRRLRVARAE